MRHLWELYDFNSKTLAQALDWQERVLPGFLAPAANDLGNHAVLTMDYSKFLPDKIQDQHDWNMMMYLFIVLMEALSTDLDEIRTGSVWVCQCEQFGWKVSACFLLDVFLVHIFFVARYIVSNLYSFLSSFKKRIFHWKWKRKVPNCTKTVTRSNTKAWPW